MLYGDRSLVVDCIASVVQCGNILVVIFLSPVRFELHCYCTAVHSVWVMQLVTTVFYEITIDFDSSIKSLLRVSSTFCHASYASTVLAVIVSLSVRPSVCPSVTTRSCTNTAKPRVILTTLYDSAGTLVF